MTGVHQIDQWGQALRPEATARTETWLYERPVTLPRLGRMAARGEGTPGEKVLESLRALQTDSPTDTVSPWVVVSSCISILYFPITLHCCNGKLEKWEKYGHKNYKLEALSHHPPPNNHAHSHAVPSRLLGSRFTQVHCQSICTVLDPVLFT